MELRFPVRSKLRRAKVRRARLRRARNLSGGGPDAVEFNSGTADRALPVLTDELLNPAPGNPSPPHSPVLALKCRKKKKVRSSMRGSPELLTAISARNA